MVSTRDPLEMESSEDEGPQEPLEDGLHHRAATIIQRAWRRHVDTEVFKYFTKLISLRNQGDPRMLLKTINPREAELLDAAAGVFVRFRLGGITFPPSIYYKVFTHRPIVDVCANSPKDYTHPGLKKPVARQTHNGWPLVPEDRSGWYRRVENNGWRLLSGKVAPLDDFMEDSANRKLDFHHSKVQRQQDVEKRRKRRKIEWLKKIYKQGRLQARPEQPDVATLVENSAQGMMHAVEEQGDEEVMEWEVDELLAWTNGLNFEEYSHEWRNLAVSHSSEPSKGEAILLSFTEICSVFSHGL
ncbi:protein MFI [Centroberyx gerrardi]|uniref:protein MFI n=1 Tax=Centroberyx gerrardi TaxID=166262 RepID=UPI003AAC3D43